MTDTTTIARPEDAAAPALNGAADIAGKAAVVDASENIIKSTAATPGMDATGNTAAVSSPQTATLPQTPAQRFEHTKIHGRFSQYISGYWALLLPLLSGRYLAEWVNNVVKPKMKASPNPASQFEETAWALAVGVFMMAVTTFYTSRTYGDIKRQFKDVVGWEFNKDPEKVNIIDIVKSKNTLVKNTVQNFSMRTTLRYAVNLPFFSFFIPTPFAKNAAGQAVIKNPFKPGGPREPVKVGGTEYTQLNNAKGSVNAGVGFNSFYLASDALSRKKTFFEEMQSFIDTKLNQKDRIGELVTAQDLINLYARQSDYEKSTLPLPAMNTPQWQDDMKLFSRMADLMNQTYGNTPNVEQANFTMPKLIYLLGMKHIGKARGLAQDLSYVEVANRYGVKAVDQIANQVKAGGNLEAALSEWPVAKEKIEQEIASTPGTAYPNEPQKKFVNESLMNVPPAMPPSTHAEKAAQANGVALGMCT